MDDRTGHYFTSVGQMLDQAALGELRVTLELLGGQRATGIPKHTADEDSKELNDTGHSAWVTIGDDQVELSSVLRATLMHPHDVGHAESYE